MTMQPDPIRVKIGPRRHFPRHETSGFWPQAHKRPSIFKTIEERDGDICVVGNCPYNLADALDNCHVIPRVNDTAWQALMTMNNIPQTTATQATHPGNGLRMCKSHHVLFDTGHFYIRWVPEIQNYIFVSFRDELCLRPFHGCKMRLNPLAEWAPHPNLLIAMELHFRYKPTNTLFIDKEDRLNFSCKWEPEKIQELVLDKIKEWQEVEEGSADEEEDCNSEGTTLHGSNASSSKSMEKPVAYPQPSDGVEKVAAWVGALELGNNPEHSSMRNGW